MRAMLQASEHVLNVRTLSHGETEPVVHTLFEERFAFCGQFLMLGTRRVVGV